MMKNAVIILAAGNSSRLGAAKQLLRFNNNSLLGHTVAVASALDNTLVIVVTGAEHDRLLPELNNPNIAVCNNHNWMNGMGSSVSAGVTYASQQLPELQTCILLVCDQPFLSAQLLTRLIATQEMTGKGIVGSQYEDTVGTPVLFTTAYFDALRALSGEQGARTILKKYSQDLAIVPFEQGSIDIDTPQAYQDLLDSTQEKS